MIEENMDFQLNVLIFIIPKHVLRNLFFFISGYEFTMTATSKQKDVMTYS